MQESPLRISTATGCSGFLKKVRATGAGPAAWLRLFAWRSECPLRMPEPGRVGNKELVL